MPDSKNPTSETPPALSERQETIAAGGESRLFGETQRAVLAVASDLEVASERLAAVAARLPKPEGRSRFLIELRGAIDGVRGDLLEEAIDTLRAAGTVSEAKLRRRLSRRICWRVI